MDLKSYVEILLSTVPNIRFTNLDFCELKYSVKYEPNMPKYKEQIPPILYRERKRFRDRLFLLRSKVL